MLALRGALEFLGLVLGVRVIQAKRILTDQKIARPRRSEQGFEIAYRPQAESRPRRGDLAYAVGQRIASGGQEPRQRLGQIGPANGEGAQRIEKPARDLEQNARM